MKKLLVIGMMALGIAAYAGEKEVEQENNPPPTLSSILGRVFRKLRRRIACVEE